MSYNIDWNSIDQNLDPNYDPAMASAMGDPGAQGNDPGGGPDPNQSGPQLPNSNTPDPVAADLGTDTTTPHVPGSISPTPIGDATEQQMLESANATAAGAGQPNPGDVLAARGIGNPGIAYNTNTPEGMGIIAQQQADAIQRQTNQGQGAGGVPPPNLAESAPAPRLPNPGIGAPSGAAGGSGTGQLSDAEWQKDFQQANGYYNPEFNSRDAFLHEAQLGDTAIRGATGGGDQLARMAQYDSDAKRLYDTIGGTPDFYKGQQAADWAGLHNQQVAGEYQAALGQGGQQAAKGASNQGVNTGLHAVNTVNQAVATGNHAQLDWLKSQLVDVPASPLKNQDAFPVAAEIVKDLQILGVDPKTIHMDDAGTIHFVTAGGKPNYFDGNAPLANWVGDLATLKAAIAQQQQAPPAATAAPGGGGGGYPPRNNYSAPRGGYPPRGGGGGGGGGGNPPPAAPALSPNLGYQPTGQPGDFAYGSVGGYPALAANVTFDNNGQKQYPLLRPGLGAAANPNGVNY